MLNLTLAAVAIQRRAVAIALFRQTHLEEVLVRQLSTDQTKARSTLIGFVRQVVERHQFQLAVFELAGKQSERIQILRKDAEEICRSEGIPITAIVEQKLFRSFATPALRRKDPLRKIARSLWPILNSPRFGHASLDAAALGLHAQVERLFNINSPMP